MTNGASREILRRVARQAMKERGLLADFSPEARAEAEALAGPAASTGEDVQDLRQLLWCSIDNDDSRDLDQLTVAEPQPGGAVKVLVAVADVDALVAQDSALDAHARANTTSVYTAAAVFPMLPERLSTDLTSLNEGEERLALVFELSVKAEGTVSASDVYRAAVLNRAQLAYDAVAVWLDGAAPAPAKVTAVPGLDEQLRLQDRVAQAMKAVRHAKGALSLRTLEARAVFSDGALTDLRADVPNRAKELIEDFMVGANGAVARFLDAKGVASLRRVLRAPERWERIAALAAGHGGKLPPAPDAVALEAFLTRQQEADPARFPDLSLAVVKLLGRGEYALTPAGQRAEGHFGLAVEDYAHSTAPNRRFPDLVTHRLLKAALDGRPAPYADLVLEELAAHCTEQEKAADKVERQVRKSAAALLLLHRVGERFEAMVTGAAAKGTWVRLERPPVEGRVVRGFEGLDVGHRVTVQLLRADVERGFIDFAAVGGARGS